MSTAKSRLPDDLGLLVQTRSQRRSWTRFRRLIRGSVGLTWQADRKLVVITTVIQLSGSLVLAGQVIAIRVLLDAILGLTDGSATTGSVVVPIVVLAGLNAVAAVSNAVQGNLQRLLGELVSRTTWHRILDVTGTVGLRAFESPAFYDRLQRVQTAGLMRPFQLTQSLIGLVGSVASVVALSIAVVSLEPLLLPLLLLAGVPMFVTSRRESRLEFAFTVEQTPAQRMRMYLGGVQTGRDEAKEIRAFGLASTLRERFDGIYTRYVADLRRHLGRRSRLALVGNLGAAVFLGLALVALVWLIDRGRIGLAEAGAAIVAIRLLLSQVTTVFKSAQQIFESGLFLDDLEDFVAMRPAAEEAEGGAPGPSGFDEITVDNLEFTYPDSGTPALRDVSMRIRSGEIIALVGENGSGKTTLAKLLATLYDPDSGSIAWDGVGVASYRRGDLRQSIAVIFQDFVHYQMTARDNIGLGRVDRLDDTDAIVEAARHAGIDDALESLPHGYDTMLSRQFGDGRDLSGGQWQRVALARAYVRDAPFVILDEPSAALDPRAEHRLFHSLRGILAGRTVLFISHRFSSVRSADRIYVLHEGAIIEHGTHDELMVLDGRYAELFRLQASAYLGPASDTTSDTAQDTVST